MIITATISLLAGLALGGYAARLRKTKNKDRAFGAHRFYFVSENPFNPTAARRLYTPHGDAEAVVAALKNPEDFR